MTRKLTFLILALLALISGPGWGQTREEKSIEINTTNSGVTGSYADKTFDVDDVTFGFTQWMKNNVIQAKKSTTNSLYNDDAIPGNIKSITFVQTQPPVQSKFMVALQQNRQQKLQPLQLPPQ